jgi:sulfur carrier protein ThiS adenylyltransferase
MIIGIAGAGGIGSNVARYLAQAKVPRIRVLDFDRVESSNLDRQFYGVDQIGRPKVKCLRDNLLKIHPDMDVDVVHHRLAPGESLSLFKGCDLVVEGFDDPVAKKHLVEELSAENIPMVCASGIAGRDLDVVKTRRIGSCHIVGDFSTDIRDAVLFPPKIGMIAALMAGIVLEWISEKSERSGG